MTSDRLGTDVFDVAVVGGGPAGLTAALWLARYLHDVVVIDSGDPRNWETRSINGYTGLPGLRPADLRGRARDECRRYGATLLDGCVVRARPSGDDGFALDFEPIAETKAEQDATGPGDSRPPDDNTPSPNARLVRAQRVLLAFGLRDQWPKLPGLRRVYGATAHVCPDCDGYETRGKKVLVIASGRKAVGMALSLRTWTTDIVVCTNGESAPLDDALRGKLDALGIPVVAAPITCVLSEGDRVRSVELEGGGTLACEEIFFALGQRLADDLGAQLGCRRDDDGRIVVDERYETTSPNVYAAGDIIPGSQIAIAAAGDGALAAVAIHRSLLPEAQRLA